MNLIFALNIIHNLNIINYTYIDFGWNLLHYNYFEHIAK